MVATESLDKGGASGGCSVGEGHGISGPIRESNRSFFSDSGGLDDPAADEGVIDSNLLLLDEETSAGVESSILSKGRPSDSRSSSGLLKRSPHMNRGFETSPALKIPGRPGFIHGGGSSSGQYLNTLWEGCDLFTGAEGAGYLGGDG